MTIVIVGIIVSHIKDTSQVNNAPLYHRIMYNTFTPVVIWIDQQKYNTRAILNVKRNVWRLDQYTQDRRWNAEQPSAILDT